MKRAALMVWAVCASSVARAQNFPGDEALSKVLLDDEPWQVVAEGLGFADAAYGDGDGNFYFSDLKKGVVHKVASDGTRSVAWDRAPAISGFKAGPDGRFVVATQGPKRQILAVDPATWRTTVLAERVTPNDLVVTKRGHVYFTDTAAGAVMLVDTTTKRVRTVASGLQRPNGITLSPDDGTLVVSEHGGRHAWAFRVEPQGELTAAAPWIDLRTPMGRSDSGGDGATTDAAGRFYIASSVGIQMFDWTGRLGGVIAKPSAANVVSVAFAGPGRAYLYVCAGDRVYRRRTKATAVGGTAAQ